MNNRILLSELFHIEHLNWSVYFGFSLLILAKIVICHFAIFHSILLSSLWLAPVDFWAFWLKKLVVAMIGASLVFVVKNKGWTIVELIVIDLWIYANYIYYRANGLLLTFDQMLIVDNMHGFWNSVIAYVDKWVYINAFLTLLWGLILLMMREKNCLDL